MDSPHYTRGTQLFELKRFAEAIKSFKKQLSIEPDDFFSKYYLALCYLNIDDFNKAEELVKSILATNPDFSNAHYLNSILSYNNDKLDEAIKHIDIAISIDPYDADFFGHKALIFLAKKQYKTALKNADEGLKIDAKNLHCLNTRTQALTKLKRKEEAFETLQNTLSDNPEDNFTHANAGWTNLEIGNHKEAKNHFKEALSRDPNDEYARQGMVQAIKSKNIFYRGFLKYAFWIEKQSKSNQWFIIIGIYLAYRFSHILLKNSSLSFLVPILVIAYMLFVFGSWLINPISNAILLFNNYGKYLLDRKDKESGIILLSLLSISLISIILFYTLANQTFLTISLTSLVAILPMTHSRQFLNKNSALISLSYGILMLLIGYINAIFLNNNMMYSGIVFFMFIGYTWLSGLLKE